VETYSLLDAAAGEGGTHEGEDGDQRQRGPERHGPRGVGHAHGGPRVMDAQVPSESENHDGEDDDRDTHVRQRRVTIYSCPRAPLCASRLNSSTGLLEGSSSRICEFPGCGEIVGGRG